MDHLTRLLPRPLQARVIVCGHRGNCSASVENTLPSFESALYEQAPGIEFDIRPTRDGRLVVYHDPDLTRLSKRQERIQDLDWEELAQIPIGPKGARSERIPLFETVLDMLAGKALPIIEVKVEKETDQRAVAESILSILMNKKMHYKCIISSFDVEFLSLVNSLTPGLSLALISDYMPFSVPMFLQGLHLNAKYVDWNYVYPHRHAWLLLWTVNDRDTLQKAIHYGAQAVITDDLGALHQTLRHV